MYMPHLYQLSQIIHYLLARVAELVDARDLKSLESNLVPVRLRPWALYDEKIIFCTTLFVFI